MKQVAQALFFAGAGAMIGVTAYAQAFPNIRGAQENLREAMILLDRAPNRFGGHKARAMQLMQGAYEELEEAMQYAIERRY